MYSNHPNRTSPARRYGISLIAAIALLAAVAPAGRAQGIPEVRSVRPSSVAVGPVSLTVNGKNFDPGSTVYFGPAGAELPAPTVYESSRKLTIAATVPAEWVPAASLFVMNPGDIPSSSVVIPVADSGGGDGGGGGGGPKGGGKAMSREEAMRFLYQTTWGPTEESIAHLIDVGKDAFLEEQFAAIPSTYPDPPDPTISTSFAPAQEKFFHNAIHGDDQLRQRMAFFLSQIWVVSANTTGQIQQMVPYLRVLDQHALGNYRDIIQDITLNPTMGRYLDMVNNRKTDPNSGINPNENYAREILQLFTVGPTKLNGDGSEQTDGMGMPVSSYDEDTIINLARVFTGWTYPTKPGELPRCYNPSYWEGPMVEAQRVNSSSEIVSCNYHDTDQKVLMDGFIVPAGGTPDGDLNLALDHIFEHPNVGPFVAVRMIRHFVTSNPDPRYVQRVAKVFDNNGSGVRGDMKAVIKAVLLDREADSTDAAHTHLREPILYLNALLRAFRPTVEEANVLRSRARQMEQDVFRAPSVFNYFHLAHGTFHGDAAHADDGPEFAIHTLTGAIQRADFAYRVARNIVGTGVLVDLTEFLPLTNDPGALVDAVIPKLVPSGALSAAERQSIINAVSAVSASDPNRRVEYAVYLVAAARFQVQH